MLFTETHETTPSRLHPGHPETSRFPSDGAPWPGWGVEALCHLPGQECDISEEQGGWDTTLVMELGRRAQLGSSGVCLQNQTPQRAPVLWVGLGSGCDIMW